jgi:NADPH:quinone reductase-like Zn-dependent oxidoreductase
LRSYTFSSFGIEQLKLTDVPEPKPGDGEVLLEVKAISLNFRDLMVLQGIYNPKLFESGESFTPISDGAGVVAAVGPGVSTVKAGDRVVSHFIAGWIDGHYQGRYRDTSLGTPGPGLAAERVVLPERALLPIPECYSFAEASTLPIAALTAWSCLVTEGRVETGQSVLTLGTGGVSVFAVQLANALGAETIITSSSDEKLETVRGLGANHTINYRTNPEWHKQVLEITGGQGVHLTVETGGAGTLNQSIIATRAGGTVALLGVLSGVKAEVNTVAILMKRLHIAGIYVDSRASFQNMLDFMAQHHIRPVISRTTGFDQLRDQLRYMESGGHFGKLVITLE